jgi:hypothetical protein
MGEQLSSTLSRTSLGELVSQGAPRLFNNPTNYECRAARSLALFFIVFPNIIFFFDCWECSYFFPGYIALLESHIYNPALIFGVLYHAKVLEESSIPQTLMS